MIHRQSDDRLQSKSGRLPIYLNVHCNALVSNKTFIAWASISHTVPLRGSCYVGPAA